MFLLCDFEKLFWVISKLFSEKVYFCHLKSSEKVCFLDVIFKEKVLSVCCSEV